MALESAADFNAYLDIQTGHGVTAVYGNSTTLWDSRNGLIDTWYDIDSGNKYTINVIINQEYFGVEGGTVDVNGFQPVALVKTIDVPNVAFGDTLDVAAIKDTAGNILTAATSYTIVNVQPDRTGFTSLLLEEV